MTLFGVVASSFRAAVSSDSTAPTITAVAVGLAGGASTGFVRSSGSYNVFAVASDDVALANVVADISAIGTGTISLFDVGGPWSVGGTTYTHKSADFTAQQGLSGTKSFSVTATDTSNNTASLSGTVTVDDIAPAGSDIQGTNGGVFGRADAGDYLVFTFTEPIDPSSLLSGWTGQASIGATVRIIDGGAGNDTLAVFNATNTTQVALGTVNLGRTDYVSATVTFSSSSMAISGNAVTVTLGPPSASARVTLGTNAGSMVWTPSSAATDRAGNPCSTTAVTEGGTADRDF